MEPSIPAKTRAYRNYGTDEAALELFHYDAGMDGTQDQFSSEVRQYGTRAIENFIGRHKDILLAKGQLHLLRQIEKSIKNPRADISSLATQTFNVLDDYLQVHRDSRAAQETGVHPYAKAVRRDEQGPDHKKVGDMAHALTQRFPFGLRRNSSIRLRACRRKRSSCALVKARNRRAISCCTGTWADCTRYKSAQRRPRTCRRVCTATAQ